MIVSAAAIGMIAATALTGCVSKSYVAKVNGEKITVDEYNDFLVSVQVDKQITEGKNDIWNKKNQEGKSYAAEAKENALEMVVYQKVQLQKAKEKNLKLAKEDEAEVQKKYDGYLKEYPNFQKKYGWSKETLLKFLKDITLITKLEEIITNEAFEKEYPQYIKATHILIPLTDENQQPLPKEKQEAAKKQAEEVLAKVKAGGDFNALAKQYGKDPGLEANGGYYMFGKGDMVPEFEKAAYDLKEGQFTQQLVKTDYGYHIIKRLPIAKEDKEKAKQNYIQKQQMMQYQGMPSVYNEQVEKWRKEAKVEKNQKELDKIVVKAVPIELPKPETDTNQNTQPEQKKENSTQKK